MRWREGFLTLRCGGRRSTSQRSRQRSRHNGPPRARKGCHPRRAGASWGSACGAGVGGRLTNLVHLAKLLLQVLLGHASETRVDHLNNLPERSRREKLRCGGGRSALNDRRGVLCTRARRTNCLRCSSRFVMNFFVRIVTAPSDMVEKYLQPQGSCGELRLATDGAGAHDRLRRGTMARGPIAGGHRNGLHGYLLLEGSRCRGTGLGGGA